MITELLKMLENQFFYFCMSNSSWILNPICSLEIFCVAAILSFKVHQLAQIMLWMWSTILEFNIVEHLPCCVVCWVSKSPCWESSYHIFSWIGTCHSVDFLQCFLQQEQECYDGHKYKNSANWHITVEKDSLSGFSEKIMLRFWKVSWDENFSASPCNKHRDIYKSFHMKFHVN